MADDLELSVRLQDQAVVEDWAGPVTKGRNELDLYIAASTWSNFSACLQCVATLQNQSPVFRSGAASEASGISWVH